MRIGRIGPCILMAGAYIIIIFAITMAKLVKLNVHLAIGLSVVSVCVLMLVQLAFVISVVGLRMRPRLSALLALLSAAVFVGILFSKLHAPMMAILGLASIQQLSLMLFAAALGYTISFIVREPNILLPIAIFAAFVDYWSVTWGPLSQILEKKPAIVAAVSVHMPTPVPGVPGTMIGMGDFVFLALFFGVLYRFSMNVKGTFWLGYGLLTASMLVVMGLGGALPALIPMGLAVVAANAKLFKLKREELLAIVYVGALLLVVLIASGIFLFER